MDNLTAKYRKLLVSAESLQALDDALALVESASGARFAARDGQVDVTLAGKHSAAKAAESIAALGDVLNLPGLSLAASRRRRTASNRARELRVLRSVLALSVAPILAARIEPALRESRFSLVQDACLLLFHHAYFALLPELGAGWQTEHESLLSAFQVLAGHQSRAADRFNVLALTFDARDEIDRAAMSYREVVAATSSDAHDFMTCLQSAWAYLMEHDRADEAFDFLLENMPRVTLADQDELRGLLKQTFSLAHSHA